MGRPGLHAPQSAPEPPRAAILVTLFCVESLATASHKASGFVSQFREDCQAEILTKCGFSRNAQIRGGRHARNSRGEKCRYISSWHPSWAVVQLFGEFAEGQGERKIRSILY